MSPECSHDPVLLRTCHAGSQFVKESRDVNVIHFDMHRRKGDWLFFVTQKKTINCVRSLTFVETRIFFLSMSSRAKLGYIESSTRSDFDHGESTLSKHSVTHSRRSPVSVCATCVDEKNIRKVC